MEEYTGHASGITSLLGFCECSIRPLTLHLQLSSQELQLKSPCPRYNLWSLQLAPGDLLLEIAAHLESRADLFNLCLTVRLESPFIYARP